MRDARDEVEVAEIGCRPGYRGFFRITVRTLRHRRFDGSMSAELVREVFERGNAVAVLPYDPRTDSVCLIRQFLPGAYVAGVPARPLQAIAGMVDKDGESSEGVARREAGEEAGVTVGRMVPAHAFLPSPAVRPSGSRPSAPRPTSPGPAASTGSSRSTRTSRSRSFPPTRPSASSTRAPSRPGPPWSCCRGSRATATACAASGARTRSASPRPSTSAWRRPA